jgi:WD40 repeat protein
VEALEYYPYTYQAEQALSQAVMQSRLRRVFYHTDWVWSVQWSPDGKRLLTASDDGTARIWEPFGGKELLSLTNDGEENIALWSDDGTQVLTVVRVLTDDEENWNIILWDSHSGEKLVVMEGHIDTVYCAYWSPDGSRILSGSKDSTARIWDAKTGELLRSLEHNDDVLRARWSPDSETFVTVGYDAPVIWDASTGEQILSLKGPAERTTDGHWSPDGNRLLTNTSRNTPNNFAKVWDTSNGELLHAFPILHIWGESQWSPDGQKILVRDQKCPGPMIYDAKTGEKLLDLDPGNPNADPKDMAWSPSGNRVAAGFFDGSVVVWDASDGDILFMLRGHSSQVNGGSHANSLHWSPDGRWLASGSRDGGVMVWDTRPKFTISNFPGNMTNARWSPTGDRILQAHEFGANMYDSSTGNLLLSIKLGNLSFGDYWSPLGDKFGLGLENGEVRIYDASNGAEILRIVLPGNTEAFGKFSRTHTFFGWSPDGQRIATGHTFGGSIRIWNALSGEELLVVRNEIENFTQGKHIIYEVRWSPLGDKILTADTLHHLIVWDANTGEKLLHIKDFDDNQIWKAAWSPDGTRIATHTRSNIGNIWDAATGDNLLRFSGHMGEVWGLFWSPTGERLATGGYDNTVRVWDTSTGEQVLHYAFDRKVDHVDWSPDGETLLISNDNRLMVLPVWNSTQELIDYARECCWVRELTPEEREFFGLPSID